jgi:hypothetical protein
MFYKPTYPRDELVNGYFYGDPGSDGKWISSTNAEDRGVVVDSTVDEYKVVGSKILVARRNTRPDARSRAGEVQRTPACEYWVIDTIAHTTIRSKKTEEWGGTDVLWPRPSRINNSLREFCGTGLCIVMHGRVDRNERP